ncbi:polysaccharide deacetylase family protein [Bacteroidota bacterium]
MSTICLYFQVHQPFRFRRYRFFDIGNEHYYYDDYSNESILRKVAEKCYLPANNILLDLIRKYDGRFKVAFSISGIAMDQMELYAPDVLESFKSLAKSGHVEFLAETNSHSLVSLKDEEAFRKQVVEHGDKIKKHFNQEPKVFRNTELVYSDEIGAMVARMGYEAMLTEGAKHILGWKSPNYLYCNAIDPKLKVLLKNFKLSDDIAFRFSDQGWEEYPLTAEKFVGWLNQIGKDEETVNLFMDYETFGEHQWEETGIFEFLKSIPEMVFANTDLSFSTPSEVARNLQPVSAVQVPYPISWADEERDLTAWLGNELQNEAFNHLYDLSDKLKMVNDPVLEKDWNYLQVSDHFYYMCTKFFSDGAVHSYFNPYDTPYDAFINYMNILSDFTLRVNAAVPETTVDKEVSNLYGIINEKDQIIQKYEQEIYELNKQSLTGKASTPKDKKVAGKNQTKKKVVSAAAKKTDTAKKEVPARKTTAGKKKA